MPRRAAPLGRPEIALDARLAQPLYRQLYERLRLAILEGQLERGARLPSTRALASELGISRATATLAYEQLVSEGYLEGRGGQGTTVARRLPRAAQEAHLDRRLAREDERPVGRTAALACEVHDALPDEAPHGRGSFRTGEPALDLFPYELWARLVARNARDGLARQAHEQPPAGFEALREAIVAHIAITRGVRCTAEQVIITTGAQGALNLVARTLLNPGDAAWVENPGYFGVHGALRATGARLVPVPVDAAGLDVAAGQRRAPDARLVAVTPSHQFPTGVTLSMERRLELLAWAQHHGAWIVEDDYDSEFRFCGRPLEALQGLDRSGRVLYVGSFSKTLFPALRLGYLVAPADLVRPLLAMRRVIDGHGPILEQLALAEFLREGHYARHLRRMLRRYRQRRDLLVLELRQQLADVLEVWTPEAGIHLVGWLPPGWDDLAVAELSARHGIGAAPLSRYSLEPLARGGLLFGYASTSEAEIVSAVGRLAAALRPLLG